MKKQVFGRKLKRTKNERSALFKSLISSLILHERIKTTHAKAKAIKPAVDKLVTKAKKLTNSSLQNIQANIYPNAMEKFISDTAKRFKDRNGGYTRIIKIKKRFGDEAPMAILEWTEMTKAVATTTPQNVKNKPLKKLTKTAKPVRKKTAPKTKSAGTKKSVAKKSKTK